MNQASKTRRNKTRDKILFREFKLRIYSSSNFWYRFYISKPQGSTPLSRWENMKEVKWKFSQERVSYAFAYSYIFTYNVQISSTPLPRAIPLSIIPTRRHS